MKTFTFHCFCPYKKCKILLKKVIFCLFLMIDKNTHSAYKLKDIKKKFNEYQHIILKTWNFLIYPFSILQK